jgi:hypothetical protein
MNAQLIDMGLKFNFEVQRKRGIGERGRQVSKARE